VVLAAGCGREGSRTAQTQRPGDDARGSGAAQSRAETLTCAEWITQLRSELADAPREVEILRQAAVPPVVSTGLRPWDSLHTLVALTNDGFEYLGRRVSPLAPDAFDRIAWLLESGARSFFNRPPPGTTSFVIDILVDAEVRVSDVARLLDIVDTISAKTRLPIEARLVFRLPDPVSYKLPADTPEWVQDMVRGWHADPEVYHVPQAKAAFTRASGDCEGVVDPAESYVVASGNGKQESEVVAALEACDCAGVDRAAFSGLMLGVAGYRSPYGVWPVEIGEDSAARSLAFAETATMTDVAEDLAKAADGALVRLLVNESNERPRP
jgi:hypothetical protein